MKTPIVILHGWSNTMTHAKYLPLAMLLKEKGYTVFVPDLPGFGKEALTKPAMELSDYVTFVKEFLTKKGIKKVILIGHSFGGRVATKFSVEYPSFVSKLVVCGAPLIKEPLPLKKQLIASSVALVKKTPFFSVFTHPLCRKALYAALGEWDYYKAGNLQATFQRIISEDLQGILHKISVPMLVIWGEQDSFVPVRIARRIVSLIPHAKLCIVPGQGHKLPYENPKLFVSYMEDFLKEV